MNVKLIPLLAFLLLLTACTPDAPQVIPTATQKAEPTPVTPTATPSHTPTKTPAITCKFNDEFLSDLKNHIPYQEFTLIYNIISEESTLLVWYVDPEIDPATPEADFQKALTDARMRAASLANDLYQAAPCVAHLVDTINTIVLDANYVGWFSGHIYPDQLPGTDAPGEEQIRLSMARFQSSYLLDYPPEIAEAPAGACTWGEARQAIQQHFDQQQENVGFYYVADPNGVNMWAQWVGSTDQDEISTNVHAILSEINCLYPSLYNLVTLVMDAQTGQMVSLGMLSADADGLDFNNYQILYIQE